jgi:four helix bundle protein
MEAKRNAVQEKSYAFALDVVRLVKQFRRQAREYELSGQLIRAATSIGANVEEAIAGQSRRDFAAKMAIASKEARETRYWLRLMSDAEMLEMTEGKKLIDRCEEMIRILTAIVKTSRSRDPAKSR